MSTVLVVVICAFALHLARAELRGYSSVEYMKNRRDPSLDDYHDRMIGETAPLVARSSYKDGNNDRIMFGRPNTGARPCLSCMTDEMMTNWHRLQHIYARPANFTARCSDLLGRIRTVECKGDTPCVTMTEPRYLAGYLVGENVIRGCYDKIFVGEYRMPDWLSNSDGGSHTARHGVCHKVSAKSFLPRALQSTASDKSWQICTCHGVKCNSNVPSAASFAQRSTALVALLLASFTWSCRR